MAANRAVSGASHTRQMVPKYPVDGRVLGKMLIWGLSHYL